MQVPGEVLEGFGADTLLGSQMVLVQIPSEVPRRFSPKKRRKGFAHSRNIVKTIVAFQN